MIARGHALRAIADRLCSEVEKRLPGVVCSTLTVDRGGLLHPLSAPSLPEAYSALLDGLLIGPYVGSCGRAAYLRLPVVVHDLDRDPKWAKFKTPALALGLRACWSIPVVDQSGTTVGVFALYFREMRGPTRRERRVVSTCIHLLELAFARQARVTDQERRAFVDALTGLPNRAAFNAALTRVPCDEPGGWALFLLDLDNLKSVNDTFGHQAGDALIRAAAERIAAASAPDVAFRLGGDEFAVIVQNQETLRDLAAGAARIFDALERPADCDGHVVTPRATIGGAVLSHGDRMPDVVRKNADLALYHAKETGRGGFVRYWPGIGTRITHRIEAIRDTASALRDDRIDAHYLPVVRLDSREIVGVEALCRMRTPDGGIVAAAAFQEATSDAHVAAELTQRMLSIVATDVRRWLDRGIPFQHVSVNIASADFHTGRLPQQLAATFGAAGVPLEHVLLEVPEGVYMAQRDRVVRHEIAALRAQGFRVALDDFGTGYASLTHLMSMPVDIIKIDRTFVAKLAPGDASLVVVHGLLDIAARLGIRVVAEGIETEEQAELLRVMGCTLGQGYLFSAPVDRDATAALLLRHAQGIEGVVPLVAAPALAAGEAIADVVAAPPLLPTGSD